MSFSGLFVVVLGMSVNFWIGHTVAHFFLLISNFKDYLIKLNIIVIKWAQLKNNGAVITIFTYIVMKKCKK